MVKLETHEQRQLEKAHQAAAIAEAQAKVRQAMEARKR